MATQRERQSAGSGYVFLRGQIYWCQYHDHGRRVRVSTGKTRERAAKAFLTAKLADLNKGRRHAGADRVTFDDLETLVLAHYRDNFPRSLARTEYALANLRGYFRSQKALDLDLAAYNRERTKEGAKPATRVRELAVLRQAFALAVENKLLADIPAMPSITVNNARTGYFERANLDALLVELPEPLRAPTTFCYLTGWRMAGEVLSLRWSQVDLVGGFVRLEPNTTKNDDGREFPIHALPELHTLLIQQRERTPTNCEWVFHRGGRRIKNMRTAWKNASQRANLAGKLPHDFRRTAVRNLLRSGVSEDVAQKLVGHKTNAMLMRYAIVSGPDLAEGVAKLARATAVPASAVPSGAEIGDFSHNSSHSGEVASTMEN